MKTLNINPFEKLKQIHPLYAASASLIILIAVGTGIYQETKAQPAPLLHEAAAANQPQNATAVSAKPIVPSVRPASATTDVSVTGSNAAETTAASAVQPPAASTSPLFNFVDASHWNTHASRDGSFSIKYEQGLIYATCPDLADNLMTAMAGPTGSDMACGSLQGAVSVQPYGGHADTYVLRTETAIAQTDDIWDRGSAKPYVVTLSGGQTAQRYVYDSTILGKNYRTIEYDTTVGGKRYVAVDNWQQTREHPNTSTDQFDTMIQKTWTFN